jgi:hypothetical protein
VTLVVVLVVALGAMLGVAGLRLAQMRSVPMASPRAYPASGPGQPGLEVSSEAWSYPSSPQVQDVLSRYFDAINSHNYGAWAATMTPAAVGEQTDTVWAKLYGKPSTQAGTIRLSRVDEVAPGRVVALVSYVTAQSPDDAPNNLKLSQVCWRVSYALAGTPPKIDISGPSSVTLGPCAQRG